MLPGMLKAIPAFASGKEQNQKVRPRMLPRQYS
jgi:hypothetical protein